MGYLMKMPMRTIQKILADHQKKCSPLDDKFGRKIRYCTSGFKSLTFSIASSTLPHWTAFLTAMRSVIVARSMSAIYP